MKNEDYFEHFQATPQDAWCKAADWCIEAASRPDLDKLLMRMTERQLNIFKAFADGFEGDYLMNLILSSGKPHEERIAMLDAKTPVFVHARQLTNSEMERRSNT